MTYEIEKDIPIPPPWGRPGYDEVKYPIFEMEVGDSIFVPVPEGKKIETVRNTLNANFRRKAVSVTGRRFACRTAEKDGVKGLRVWRTA